MSKSNLVKKLTITLFTLVAIFAVGLTNVNAETKTVSSFGELKSALSDKTSDVVKLSDNITLEDAITKWNIYTNKTLDLNGFSITVPNNRKVAIYYYDTIDFKIVDLSNSKTSKINYNYGAESLFNFVPLDDAYYGEKMNLTIDGVDIISPYNTTSCVSGKIKTVKFMNMTITGFWELATMGDVGGIGSLYLESVTKNSSGSSSKTYLSDSTSLTVNDVIDANSVVEYYSDAGVKVTADRTATLGSIDAYYGPITVKFAKGFNVSDATLTGEYGETPEANISIKNIGENDLQIKNVTVSDTNKFEIIGTTQPTVGANTTNTDFKVKAKAGLDVGNYTATITVTDMGDKTYTATVTLKVEKKNLTVGINGLSDKWVYGETKTPTATGVEGLGTGDYKITYFKENNSSYDEIGTTLPKLVGKYKATLSVTNQNYTASEASVPFEITPINTEVKVTSNDATFTYDGTEHSNNGYTVSFNGVTGNTLSTTDTVNAVVTGKVRDVSDTADGNNTIKSVTIKNADGDDVTNCYKNIVTSAGKLTVTPITTPIVVKANSDTKVYDGTELTKNTYTFTDSVLLPGDTLKATVTGSQKFVGSSNNTVSNVTVERNGEDITRNYTFGTHEDGTLKVTEATQTFNVNENVNVLVNGTLTIAEIKAQLGSNITNYNIEFVSGTGTFDPTTGFTAGATSEKVVMKAIAPAIDKNNDGTNEYAEATKTFYINVVNKENVTISGLTDNQEFTYDGTSKKPSGTIKVDGDKVPVDELVVKYTGTGYDSTEAPTNAGTYTVTYRVKDDNPTYVGSVTYTFTIKKAQLEKVTIVKDTFEYTGSDITPTLNNVNSNIEVTGDTTAKNVSNNTITAKIKDISNYEWKGGSNSDLTINWSITQATPDYTVPTGLTGVKGDTLNDVTLPDRFTWNDASTVLTAGTHTYKATYTPVDTTNYKTITDIDIEVVVKDKFDVITSVDGGNGTITPSKIGAVEGTKVEITFTPDTGYMIDKVLVNTVETTVTGNKIELTVNEEKDVKVSYKKIPFTVTVKDVDGATITPNGAVAVSYGEDKEFTITANSGYKLVKVLVDGTDKTADMVGDTLKLTNITSNINLEVVVEKIVYEVTEGANQKYTITKNNEAKFKINADFRLFDEGKVYVDNELVDPKNYTAESGSTIITLKKEFVDTLSVGEHTLKVLFNDGGEAITTFNVARVTVPTDNPQTGDNIGFYIISGILSIVGLAGAGIFYRRKQTN